MQYYAYMSASVHSLADKLHHIMKQSRIQNVWRLLEDEKTQ